MPAKINIVVRLQHWMDSVPGQTFLNYAYSWGAAIVILGALFKLTYLPGGHTLLFIGMGTEVVVFFLSAFDRPFDKTEDGKELPLDYETDEEIARHIEEEEERLRGGRFSCQFRRCGRRSAGRRWWNRHRRFGRNGHGDRPKRRSGRNPSHSERFWRHGDWNRRRNDGCQCRTDSRCRTACRHHPHGQR